MNTTHIVPALVALMSVIALAALFGFLGGYAAGALRNWLDRRAAQKRKAREAEMNLLMAAEVRRLEAEMRLFEALGRLPVCSAAVPGQTPPASQSDGAPARARTE